MVRAERAGRRVVLDGFEDAEDRADALPKRFENRNRGHVARGGAECVV
jgi:hypothetical protein